MYSCRIVGQALIFLQISLLLSNKQQTIAVDCDGECKGLSDCPPIYSKLDHMDFNQIPFCDRSNSIVCCPKKRIVIDRRGAFPKESKNLFERECLSYRDAIYKRCDQPLIVRGNKSEPMEFPHMALIGTKDDSRKDPIKWFCGGTLISAKFVVTAAHCFYDREVPNHARLGDLDYNITTDDAQPQDFAIKNYIPHPSYSYEKKYNDIALVELDGTATFNRYVAPACLPLNNGTEFSYFLATGWGAIGVASESSTHLLKVRLNRFTDAECKNLTEVSDDLDEGVNEKTQICAGSYTDSSDTCTGDSGGPLFVEHPEYPCMYLLIGITSYGPSCGYKGFPGVYTRVNLYVDWIEKIVWNAAGHV